MLLRLPPPLLVLVPLLPLLMLPQLLLLLLLPCLLLYGYPPLLFSHTPLDAVGLLVPARELWAAVHQGLHQHRRVRGDAHSSKNWRANLRKSISTG